ncbi:hypothetical protein Tco_1180484 [Tanacetum coccineum]
MLKPDTNTPSSHFCKPVKQECNGIFKVWPTCDPTMKLCNEGNEIYGVNEQGTLKYWHCHLDAERKSMKGGGLSFTYFLLVRYEINQGDGLVWDNRYAEWCSENYIPGTSTLISILTQEDNKPRPRDYSFKEWVLIKVGHNNISESVKKALLKLWLIDCFKGELGPANDPRAKSFDDYKRMFDLEIDQLTDEYELGIGKKGHMLEDIWEYCEQVLGDNTYWWHDHGLEENERQESGLDIEEYDPPEVHVETFEVKRYSFDSGHGFICVTKEIGDTLPLGRESRSRFKEMIRRNWTQEGRPKERRRAS